MTLNNLFKIYPERASQVSRKTESPATCRTYFNATWEFWKRNIDRNLWDWAMDGPFCNDSRCGQRMKPAVKGQHNVWTCIRCKTTSSIPELDFTTLRERVVQFFEEEFRSYT